MVGVPTLSPTTPPFDIKHSSRRRCVTIAAVTCSSRQVDIRIPEYALDGLLIILVHGAGLKCRDPVTRKRIIQILKSKPPREGTINSARSAELLSMQIDIEEAGKVGFLYRRR